MSSKKRESTPLDFAVDTASAIATSSAGVSLSDFAKMTRVEPICIIDSRAASLPYAEDVLHSVLNIFTGYYLQALHLMNIQASNIDILKRLDMVNPDRSPLDSILYSFMERASEEHDPFADGLPDYSQEGEFTDKVKEYTKREVEKEVGGDKGTATTKEISEKPNLSVGKQIEVTFKGKTEDGKDAGEATMPITIRLRTITARPTILTHTLSLDSKDESLRERIHKWRAGQLNFVKDILFMQDLIQDHRENLMKDDAGIYTSEVKKRRKTLFSSVLGQSPSLASASSIWVMTTETEKEFNRMTRMDFERSKDIDKIFFDTKSMMIVVIDPEWEHVTIHTRGTDKPIEVSVREIQRSNKKSDGPDIMEVLNAMRQSRTPTI